ncbi:type VI secretion system-associated FHA domain protein TagH [Methylovirgula sp. 4M-Z18]|uniref:type VI secretion system-associated FHA domain protein TagH n=1 Tax=Methylovirgula sp. 4M-Z18 TaxID=2293567 RepID=UPI000E2ECD0F|nr:type VI secretion system-associated FHA domain protein TagH [Methylovirgula sp. 4M-Z18]RFB76357.1 type VI secretion system-associated FHA domain protein TagH [Methylovirgula sp. 4M-Z18]
MLTLRIENYDRLPDGGPLEFAIDRRGFDFGRDQHLDWTLPDPNRVISGKHCEVRFHDGAYWLTDTSRNGTYLNGASKRLQSPYRLADGDRLAVGDYILLVSIKLGQAPAAMQPVPPSRFETPSFPAAGSNIWDTSHEAPPPIDARELLPPPLQSERAPDFLHQAAYVPPPLEEPEAIRRPAPAIPRPLPSGGPWANPEDVSPRLSPAEPSAVKAPRAAILSPPLAEEPMSVKVQNASAPSPSVDVDTNEFIRRFAAGAGIAENVLSGADAGDVAEDVGRLLNLICQNMMTMLRARAEAKALSRSGNRTMISAEDNNPLKFMPTAEEALRVMLGPKIRGYLDGNAAFENAFGDLKMHQVAFLASMQAALTELFDEFAPEAIKKAADANKSMLSSSKGRYWDLYAERWAARVGRREHGMLGAFLDLYAEHYDKLSAPTRNRP